MGKRKWTDDEVRKYREQHKGFFYFNKEDSNLFAVKSNNPGTTINWANPWNWLIVGGLIVLLILIW